jgi:predicted enzyme related to lactoylglutathione lyase
MLNLNSIMIGTKQAGKMVEFYSALIGTPPGMSDSEHGFHGWQLGALYFSILDHSEMGGKTKDPGRLMLNFETKGEFERVKAIGAGVVREPYEMGGGWIATLTDPDGNYFQLVTPM